SPHYGLEEPGSRSRSRASRAAGKPARASRRQSRSSLKLSEVINIKRQPAAMDRDDHPEPDADLARRDRHHDDREDLAVAVTPHPRERDQREVRAVEHQLQAQQND